MFSCEFWEISKSTFFYKTPQVAASKTKGSGSRGVLRTSISPVKYFQKKLYLECSIGIWIHIWRMTETALRSPLRATSPKNYTYDWILNTPLENDRNNLKAFISLGQHRKKIIRKKKSSFFEKTFTENKGNCKELWKTLTLDSVFLTRLKIKNFLPNKKVQPGS